jgi:hypothetical protein
VDAVAGFPNEARDLGKPKFTAIRPFGSDPGTKSEVLDRKEKRAQERLILGVEGAVDEDVLAETLPRLRHSVLTRLE